MREIPQNSTNISWKSSDCLLGKLVSLRRGADWLEATFSPMDTPPEVMMTSARLIPSCRADSRSSGLQTQAEPIKAQPLLVSWFTAQLKQVIGNMIQTECKRAVSIQTESVKFMTSFPLSKYQIETRFHLFLPLHEWMEQKSLIIYEPKAFLLVSNNSKVDGGISVLLDGGQQRGPVGISNLSWVKVILWVQELHRHKQQLLLKTHPKSRFTLGGLG